MKARLLIAIAATFALALLAAAPALAQEPPLAIIDGAGVWDPVAEEYIDVSDDPGTQVPYGYTYEGISGWITYTRGLAQSVPQIVAQWYDLTKDGVSLIAIAPPGDRMYWGTPEVQDAAAWGIQPFNPSIGAKFYRRDWKPLLGVLGIGNYRAQVSFALKHASVDLIGYEEGQRQPIIWKPPASDSYAIEFEVVAP